MREMNCLTRASPPSQVFEHSACRTITTPAFGPSRQMRQSQRFRARPSRKPNEFLAGTWPKDFNESSPDHRCALPGEIFSGISARRPATRPSCRAVPEDPLPRSCAAAIGASPTAALGRDYPFPIRHGERSRRCGAHPHVGRGSEGSLRSAPNSPVRTNRTFAEAESTTGTALHRLSRRPLFKASVRCHPSEKHLVDRRGQDGTQENAD
jgi:hypothetical protein